MNPVYLTEGTVITPIKNSMFTIYRGPMLSVLLIVFYIESEYHLDQSELYFIALDKKFI